ncbi:HU family DNA-binding protein [Thermocrinis minervae]|uniref:DNA-binding protein HU-beta/integration host factor subunit beta n=1 Tax=Thermocrinis minervae TaxID=381751 RepID=A0A1M6T3D3_9AQUI|nr:HU family DNA-binding protein [Thermocrinis minervae]SHK51399.1 DNA-binding protein HU-beta/integration host factor subunit beta [Thermocrinis minervae]
MKRADLIKKLAGKFNLSRGEASYILDNFIDSLMECLVEHKRLEIRGFGTFYLKYRKGRFYKNPKTGVESYVDGRYLIVFKPSKKFFKGLKDEEV